MALSFGTIRAIQNILKLKFTGKESLNYHEIMVLFDEYMNNLDTYGVSTTQFKADKGESRRMFEGFVEYLLYRNIANYDSMILISSMKGTGKSSFALMLASQWCKMLGIKFDPDRHIAYTNQQVQDKIDKLNSFEPLIADESILFATTEAWAKSENKELKKKLGQVRTKHLLYILCFPLKIMKLDKVYLESYVNYWIDLFARGVGALYVKDQNPAYDTWRVKEFQNLGSYTEFTQVNKIKAILSKHPNFWYIIKAPKPPESLYQKYIKVREYNVYDDTNVLNTMNKADIIRAVLLITLREILTRDSSLSVKRLLIHLENTHGISIEKELYDSIMEDANMLVQKVKENNLAKFIR